MDKGKIQGDDSQQQQQRVDDSLQVAKECFQGFLILKIEFGRYPPPLKEARGALPPFKRGIDKSGCCF
jgi:hypothetical protein